MTSYRWQRALWITALAAGLLMTELVPAQAQQFPPPAPSLSVAAKEFQHDQVLLQQQRLRNQLAELQLEYARLQAEKRQYQAPTRRKVEVSPAPTCVAKWQW